jgi:hypothetical protein
LQFSIIEKDECCCWSFEEALMNLARIDNSKSSGKRPRRFYENSPREIDLQNDKENPAGSGTRASRGGSAILKWMTMLAIPLGL